MNIIADIAEYLEDEGLGTVGDDIYIAYLPETGTNQMGIFDTGGTQPDPYLKDITTPTFQVFIRATSYLNGKNLLDSVREALHTQSGLQTDNFYFYYILATSEGGNLGTNDTGQYEFSINFHCKVREA